MYDIIDVLSSIETSGYNDDYEILNRNCNIYNKIISRPLTCTQLISGEKYLQIYTRRVGDCESSGQGLNIIVMVKVM